MNQACDNYSFFRTDWFVIFRLIEEERKIRKGKRREGPGGEFFTLKLKCKEILFFMGKES